MCRTPLCEGVEEDLGVRCNFNWAPAFIQSALFSALILSKLNRKTNTMKGNGSVPISQLPLCQVQVVFFFVCVCARPPLCLVHWKHKGTGRPTNDGLTIDWSTPIDIISSPALEWVFKGLVYKPNFLLPVGGTMPMNYYWHVYVTIHQHLVCEILAILHDVEWNYATLPFCAV